MLVPKQLGRGAKKKKNVLFFRPVQVEKKRKKERKQESKKQTKR